MKKLVTGILAHVDAGKTTLSEAMLYTTGSIRKIGHVDNKDAFLDNNVMERERGITIFSKQARMSLPDMELTLLDTPGHVDFSAEMERTLGVLDYAILVISGADGVQGHTATLWNLLEKYQIPVFLFINKMDQQGIEKEKLLTELKERLSEGCVDFTEKKDSFFEEIALCDETVLESFLENGIVEKDSICNLIRERKLFPCYFGSALRLTGVEEFLQSFSVYTKEPIYPKEFGARVFKIGRGEQGERLTYLKVTGGSLRVRTQLSGEEKVNQIRLYSGEKYQTTEEVVAGEVCAVTGLTKTRPAEGFGFERERKAVTPVLEPVLSYQILLPEGMDAAQILPKLRQLEEEDPMLHIVWQEELSQIMAELMGKVQLEVLKRQIQDRFGVTVSFGEGAIVYKETIADIVEGVGHFEPLRHYAEVHLLLEPLPPGSGLIFESTVSEDELDKNWQRLILTHLQEKEHKGVLTGSAITDMRITLAAGKAHLKHTEGGDFRQATYRAVRQGLMKAQSVLLEPYYDFRLELPKEYIGRAMTDIERLGGSLMPPENEYGMAVLTGSAPAVCMTNYQQEVTVYTKGTGRLALSFRGYEPCHNPEEVIANRGYEPERDLANPSSSVFCAHGAGFYVEWDKIEDYMHLESVLKGWEKGIRTETEIWETGQGKTEELWLGTEEIDAILEKTFYANQGDKTAWKQHKKMRESQPAAVRSYQPILKKEEYLLVDGYNIIFAWEELSKLAKINMDGARGRLLDILSDYQGIRGCHLMVVFDAYRVQGHQTEVSRYHNIFAVYTGEAETADQYIEKFAHENAKKYQITVATSDGLEQVIIRGKGCRLLSARELSEDISHAKARLTEEYMEGTLTGRSFLFDGVSEETAGKIEAIRKGEKDERT
ncbi:translation factor GTPase family protein [Acetivibrio ethanolgignens]|uniref:Translation elongation factor G n=1 Tax=Acetivibrio ethanolgignens TaxID=290052 RepID=A0A0V8QD21_9FIRM|nr:TetM/TetW/TetO/TetS family tetracycline resistance ribosomal protection protein [Acetivibrio ethanolgignens]KSV58480.1 translation elongation factor G [Acetivibrio ethanolgignens]